MNNELTILGYPLLTLTEEIHNLHNLSFIDLSNLISFFWNQAIYPTFCFRI